MDEGNGLENRRPLGVRGFESHPLRPRVQGGGRGHPRRDLGGRECERRYRSAPADACERHDRDPLIGGGRRHIWSSVGRTPSDRSLGPPCRPTRRGPRRGGVDAGRTSPARQGTGIPPARRLSTSRAGQRGDIAGPLSNPLTWAIPESHPLRYSHGPTPGEVTESGRSCLPAKEVRAHALRGFKSHPLRHISRPRAGWSRSRPSGIPPWSLPASPPSGGGRSCRAGRATVPPSGIRGSTRGRRERSR